MTSALDERLAQLQHSAVEQTEAYESSRDKLYQNIVDTYLWWRDASLDAKYLSSQYSDAGIRFRRAGGNKPNFYPLIRLVWNIDIKKKASTVSDWARSMEALHEAATSEERKFSGDTRGALINHIHDVGGLSELRGEKGITEEELFAQEDGEVIAEDSKRGRKPGSTGGDEVKALKVTQARSVSAKAKLALFPSAITNGDDLVVMLARRNRTTNELEIVGSNYSEDLIDTALMACTDVDRAGVTPSLRLIAEAIQPHAIPEKLEKYRKNFFEKSKYVGRIKEVRKLNADGTVEIKEVNDKVRESTTVLVDGISNKIILTKTPFTATCVTEVSPKNMTLHSGSVLIMRGNDRSWFERELINNQKLSLYKAEPETELVENSTDTLTRYSLHLSSKSHKRSIYFYDASEMPEETVNGFKIATLDGSEPSWQLKVNTQWLAEFDARCVGGWLSGVKTQFKKPHNKQIGLQVTDKALKLYWWWDEASASYSKHFEMPYGNDARVVINGSDEVSHYNPKDAMLLLSALPSLPLASAETVISKHGEALHFHYETDLARYHSTLPEISLYSDIEKKKKELAAAESKVARAEKKASKVPAKE
jgi:hypothetical protein